MQYGMTVTTTLDFDDAVARTREALAEQGFGVLTEIDVRATMKAKLDADVPSQLILGACNPVLAHQAMQAEPSIGLLLPCNVVVRADGERCLVQALDPSVIADVPDNAALQPIAEEAGRRIDAALADLTA